jgi:hypothetical protein
LQGKGPDGGFWTNEPLTDAPEMLEVTVIVTAIGCGQGAVRHGSVPHEIAERARVAHRMKLKIVGAWTGCLAGDTVEVDALLARIELLWRRVTLPIGATIT